MKKKIKLFMVSIDRINGSWVGSGDSVYVVADSYDEAAQKGLEWKLAQKPALLDGDGSIKEAVDPKVTAVQIVTEDLIY